MKNYLLKKGFALTLIFLFFGLSIIPSSGGMELNNAIIPFSRGNTFYVGGNGSGNYTSIQDAIDNASDGDTVFVYDDSSPYNEWDIRINKSINLIGEDKNTTVIDGNSNYDIIIPISSCVISGFSIINGFYGIYPWLDSSENIIISDNHFVNCEYAIKLCFLSGDFDNYIISNSFREYLVAIWSDVSGTCTISDNIIIRTTSCEPNVGDISCFWGNYVITNNTFICDIIGEEAIGLLIGFVENSIIKGNKFSDYDRCAIFISTANNNIITHNNFTNNFRGICIEDKSHSNKIINNNFANNFRGICISDKSNFNKIINNNFIKNKFDAVAGLLCLNNLWDGNYWDKWIGNKIKLPIFQRFPKVIVLGLFAFSIDWHPVKEPYDI